MSRIKYPESWPQGAREELDVMFFNARKKGLWFFGNSLATGPIWFSPDELESEQKNGKFIWGAVNWQLRDPIEYLQRAEDAFDDARRERDRVGERLRRSGALPPHERVP